VALLILARFLSACNSKRGYDQLMGKKTVGVPATYHHGDLRNALIAVGTQVLEDIGPKELSLRQLARMVGVSEAAPSRHFSGKDELLAAIATQGFRSLAEQRKRIAGAGVSPQWTLLQMMKSYVKYARAHPGLFALMVGPRVLPVADYPELAQASDESFDLFASAVKSFAAAHGWPDPLLNQVTHAAWATEHGLATLLLAKRAPRVRYDVDVDAMVNLSCSLLLAGLAAGPSAVAQMTTSNN
jgi:AcrR family transcriptional regulator